MLRLHKNTFLYFVFVLSMCGPAIFAVVFENFVSLICVSLCISCGANLGVIIRAGNACRETVRMRVGVWLVCKGWNSRTSRVRWGWVLGWYSKHDSNATATSEKS